MACRDSWDIIMLDRRVPVYTMKQNKLFDSKILLIILGGAILALLLFSCTNQRPAIQTVTFDANGGKLSGEASVTVFTGFPVSEPKAPTRSGYSFSGWYLEGSSTKYDFSSPVFSDITLKAQWNKTSSPTSYTVTYHALVDGMESDAITVPNPTAAQSGSTLSTPDEPTYNETTYFFVGWSTSDTEYAALASDHIVQGNLDLWAVFVTKTSAGTSADGMLSYAFDEAQGGYTIIGTPSAAGAISIPSTINGAPVVEIQAEAFKGNTFITSIDLSGATNLKTIGNVAFGYTNIKELTIPGSVTHIGQWILENGDWDSSGNWIPNPNTSITVTIEEGATGLSSEAFWGAPISTISIPSTIKEIPELCFASSSVKEVRTTGSIKTIGINAFLNCSDLTTFDLTGVEIIGERAFAHTGITSVDIPASVATVGYGAFENGETIVIDSIPIYKFDEGDSLTVTFEEWFNGLASGSFYGAPISTITIPETVTAIPKSCFENATLLTSVTLHNDITEIMDYAFYHAEIKKIQLPKGLTKIGNYAFADNALTSLTLPDDLTYIGEKAFMSNQITGTLGIPARVMEIGQRAFYDTNISGIEFKGGANLAIGIEAFANAEKLREVTLPSSVAKLDITAFTYSTDHDNDDSIGLRSLTVPTADPNKIPLLGTSDNAADCIVYVPDGAVDVYKASVNWCRSGRFTANNIRAKLTT